MVNIDSTDLNILAELAENAKTTYVDMGKRLKLHPNVVAYRVKKLQRVGIIKQYTASVDFEKLGLTEQIYVGASFPGNSHRDHVLEQIATIPQTVKVVRSLGEPESILFVLGRNKADVEKTMEKLRDLDIKIEYTGSVIHTYEQGRLGRFLRLLAEEAAEESSLTKQNHEAIKQRGG